MSVTVTLLDHLNLTVRDFNETAEWYRRVFGFAVVERGRSDDGSPWGVLRAGEALLCVYECAGYAFLDSEARDAKKVHGLNHFGLRIADRKSWEATVTREKVTVLYGGPVRWPHSLAWYVTDPTGHEIEVALWDGNHVTFDPLPAKV
ncbi:MAG: VOC family protein [Planctomycetes bacterium]|nr:VOC family protein [Planctomycetota bacterium]